MSNSILIIGIDREYIDKIAKGVADKLGKMFLSIYDLIVYEMEGIIGNIDNIDKDYVNKQIDKAKNNALTYENCIISIDITNINGEDFKNNISELPKIYVQNKSKITDFDVIYNDRDVRLKNIANFIVSENDFDAQVEEVIEIISKIGE